MFTPLRVLIVGDSDDDAALLVRELGRGPWDVTHRRVDTTSALSAALWQDRWDLIIADASLPQCDGRVSQAMARALRPDIPFIVVSGATDEATAAAAMLAGASDCLPKGHLERLIPAVLRELAKVAERREAADTEYRLVLSEVHNRQLFDESRDGIVLLDAKTATATDVNPALCALLGRTPEQCLDRELWAIGVFPDPASCRAAIRAVHALGQVRLDAMRVERGDGRSISVSFTAKRSYKDLRPVVRCDLVDVTHRLVVVDAVRESEERFRLLVQGVEECGIYLLDVRGFVASWNACAERIKGYTAEQIVGRHISVFYPPEDVAAGKPTRALNLAAQRGWCEDEGWRVRADGSRFWANVLIMSIRDPSGCLQGFTKLTRDIGGRRAVGEVDRENEERLRAIVETAVDGIVTTDDRGTIRSFNPAAVKIFGYAPEEVIGRNVKCLVPATYHDAYDGYLANHLAGAPARYGGIDREVEALRKDGTRVPIELGVTDTKLGDVRLFTGTVRDISERKRAAAELSRAKEEAEAANRFKSEFLANMSHEIRTPMAAIIGYADLLLDPTRGPESRHADIQSIRRNGQHLLSVINDVLDLSKIEAGGMGVERIPVDLPRLAAEAGSITRPQAIEKGLALGLSFDTPVPRMGLTDPLRLRQALINLIANAVKFTRAGSVTVRVTCDGPSPTDAVVRFEVVDTGVGMTEAEQARLFQPFVQADASTTRRFGGTGLGLTISRRFARMLGGDISVRSRPDRGSTFALEIRVGPVAAADMVHDLTEAGTPDLAPGLPASPTDALAGVRVLLAEDGLDNREILTAYLRGAGVTVETIEDGRRAVAAALAAERAGHPFAVVLMDMQMPVLDGYGAASELRRLGYRRPIIALTAHAMAEDRARCLAAGCDDYLTKPVDRHTLVNGIARHVAGHHGEPGAIVAATITPTLAAAAADPVTVIRSTLAANLGLGSVIADFVGRLPRAAEELGELLDAGDPANLACAAHKLRGAGGSYGFMPLSAAAAALEDRLRAGAPVAAVTAEAAALIATLHRIEGFDRFAA